MKKLNITYKNEIIQLHGEIELSLKTSLEKAIRIGELLTGIKGKLKHGEFIPWIKDNLPFTDRTARSYVNLYNKRTELSGVNNINEAYRILAPKNIETEILTYLHEQAEFWKLMSNYIPVKNKTDIDLEPFSANEIKEEKCYSLMNEHLSYIKKLNPSYEELAYMDEYIRKMQNEIGRMRVYRGICVDNYKDIRKTCRKRMQELKTETVSDLN